MSGRCPVSRGRCGGGGGIVPRDGGRAGRGGGARRQRVGEARRAIAVIAPHDMPDELMSRDWRAPVGPAATKARHHALAARRLPFDRRGQHPMRRPDRGAGGDMRRSMPRLIRAVPCTLLDGVAQVAEAVRTARAARMAETIALRRAVRLPATGRAGRPATIRREPAGLACQLRRDDADPTATATAVTAASPALPVAATIRRACPASGHTRRIATAAPPWLPVAAHRAEAAR